MRKSLSIAAIGLPVGAIGCLILGVLFIRPYDVPEFIDVDSSESAFLIPLEGNASNQSAFQSVKYLEEKKVATKRVQIPHQWRQTGYMPRDGQYVGTVRLVKVDRRPITREWTR